VEVLIIVLLEVGRGELDSTGDGGGEGSEESSDNGFVIVIVRSLLRGGLSSFFTSLGLFWGLDNDNLLGVGSIRNASESVTDLGDGKGWHVEIGKDKVCAGVDEGKVSGVRFVENLNDGGSLGSRPELVA